MVVEIAVASELSINNAPPVQDAVVPVPPKTASETGYPAVYVEENVTDDVLMVRTEPTAEASFAAILARSRFGIALAG